MKGDYFMTDNEKELLLILRENPGAISIATDIILQYLMQHESSQVLSSDPQQEHV